MPNQKDNNWGKVTAMKQLELRTYSREEIAEVLNVNIKDVNHFKRNVETKLNNWGYSYKYYRRQFEILRAPTSAHERLSEIMQRVYNMDIRTEVTAFADFFYSLVVFPEFSAMPWARRSEFLEEEFKVQISDRTLRSWCSKFIESDYIIKNEDEKVRWVTGYCNGEKFREIVDDSDPLLMEQANRYDTMKKELIKEYKQLPPKEKWQKIYEKLWDTFHCCFYYCKGLQLSAFENKMDLETLQETIELVNEIAEREPAEIEYIFQQKIQIINK